jgi:hypothetical protein
MTRTRTLRLHRERLTELTAEEARHVVGGRATGIECAVNSNISDCVKLTCACTVGCYESINSCYLTCGCVTE